MTTSDAAAAPTPVTTAVGQELAGAVAEPAAGRRWAAVAALLGATFVGTVNNSIANVAVPSIAEDLDIDLTAAVWTISAFVLPLGILMPLAGRIGDMYGARRVFLAGTGLFAVASLVVASADHIAVVIAGRALQGAAGSPVLPCILATIARLFPPVERARAVALWAGVNAAALAAGPALGGVIVDGLSWRAIFWLSAPAIVVVGVLVAVLVPPDGRTVPRRLDLLGAGLVAVLLTTLVVPLTEAANWGWLHPLTLAPLAVSAATGVGLVRHVRRVDEPFVDPALVRQPGLVPVAAVASLQMVALFAITFAVPVFYVVGAGEGARAAGLVTSVLPASMLVGAALSGRLAGRLPLSTMIARGGTAMVAGTLVVAAGAPRVLPVLIGLAVIGGGVSLIQAPAAAAVTSLAPEGQTGIAAGLFNTARFVLGGLGATMAALLFDVGSGRGDGEKAVRLTDALLGLRSALALGVVAGAVIVVVARRYGDVIEPASTRQLPIVNSSQTEYCIQSGSGGTRRTGDR